MNKKDKYKIPGQISPCSTSFFSSLRLSLPRSFIILISTLLFILVLDLITSFTLSQLKTPALIFSFFGDLGIRFRFRLQKWLVSMVCYVVLLFCQFDYELFSRTPTTVLMVGTSVKWGMRYFKINFQNKFLCFFFHPRLSASC